MSSAFRNFILTLVLMLAIFGIAAWKLIPKLEDAVLQPVFAGTESSIASEPVSNETSENTEPVSEETSEPAKKEYRSFDCIFLAKNSAGYICSAFYVEISEEDQYYMICSLPVSMSLDNSGIPVPAYDLLGSQSTDYAVKKLSALVGRDVTYYVTADASSLVKLIQVKKDLTADLPYTAKFVNPEFAKIPESQLSDEHYIKVQAGKVTLNDSNTAGIFNSVREEGSTDFTFQQDMCVSLFKQISSVKSYTYDLVAQKKLFESFKTNIPYEKVADIADLFFAFSEYRQAVISYPTTYDYASPDVLLPNWDSGIKLIQTTRDK